MSVLRVEGKSGKPQPRVKAKVKDVQAPAKRENGKTMEFKLKSQSK